MGANGGTVDAVVTAVCHYLGERYSHRFPDPGFAPAAEPAIDGVPATVFGRNIPPWRSASEPPEYAVDDRSVFARDVCLGHGSQARSAASLSARAIQLQ